MNPINPKKLLHSKWTACQPKNKEKHFVVCELKFNEVGIVEHCAIEAVRSNRLEVIDWRELKNSEHWVQGWK